ncbi:hypothetical protein M436DRAFT_81936 [Aureobasidium namibiae CBS 147.97]|uniref:C2H2-type domain-containing protein n=1 Tax=Aureobasidium namibiae CBS 147.97 TaxID=1043004 RepID=A0A074XG36_9PEZI
MPHLSSTFILEELQSPVRSFPGIKVLSSDGIKWRIDRIGEAFANVQYVLVFTLLFTLLSVHLTNNIYSLQTLASNDRVVTPVPGYDTSSSLHAPPSSRRIPSTALRAASRASSQRKPHSESKKQAWKETKMGDAIIKRQPSPPRSNASKVREPRPTIVLSSGDERDDPIKENDYMLTGYHAATGAYRLSMSKGKRHLDTSPSITEKSGRPVKKEGSRHPASRPSSPIDSSDEEGDAAEFIRHRQASSRWGDGVSEPDVKLSGKPLSVSTIGRQTASTLTMVTHTLRPNGLFGFTCPARSCHEAFDNGLTYEQSVEHALLHGIEMFEMGLHGCPFGCRLGFIDPLQQRHHVLFDCYFAPRAPLPDLYRDGMHLCSHPECRSKYDTDALMRQHYSKVHAPDMYQADSAALNQDHSPLAHDPHPEQLRPIFLSPSPQAIIWWPSQAACYFDPCDVLLYRVSHSASDTLYDSALLELVPLTTSDLLILWKTKIRSLQMAVRYPEASAGRTAGSIHSVQIQAWKFTELPSNETSDPAAHLFPPIAPAYASRSQLPSPQLLKQLYAATTQRRKVHLTFIFRHSQSATKLHDQDHVREALALASHINGRGSVTVVSVSVIYGKYIKGCFAPSFGNDMETELE